jgi:Cd2+/Zn2+-exporting ATPase
VLASFGDQVLVGRALVAGACSFLVKGAPAGFISLRDEPNPTAPEALRQLQAAGISPVMLSGDDPRTTQAIAAELGLAEYEGHCPPEMKVARIKG